jgi:hypothetical protein
MVDSIFGGSAVSIISPLARRWERPMRVSGSKGPRDMKLLNNILILMLVDYCDRSREEGRRGMICQWIAFLTCM